MVFRYLVHFKDPLPLLGTIVSGLTTILVSLSSEVIRLDVATNCGNSDIIESSLDTFNPARSCAYGLSKSSTLMRTAEGILVTLAILLLIMAFILARWTSGLSANP